MNTPAITRTALVGDIRQFNDIPDDCWHLCVWTGRDPFSPATLTLPNGCWRLRWADPDCDRHGESS